MSATPESIALLREIRDGIRELVALSKARAAKATTAPPPASGGPEIASDRDLDGPWGDPEIRGKDPRDWSGPSMAGNHFSQAPPEYLDLLAERYDYFARKNDEGGDPKKAKYARLDAARARGWAARIRAGKVTQAPAAQPPAFVDPDAIDADDDWNDVLPTHTPESARAAQRATREAQGRR